MIKAIFDRTTAGKDEIHTVRITGHADFASHGEDIVCAAVTSIIYATFEKLLRMSGQRKCHVYDIALFPGDARLSVSFRHGKAAEAVYETLLCGLDIIRTKYPDNITIATN